MLKEDWEPRPHELVHHFVEKGFDTPCPEWANEGFAEFFEKFMGYIDSQGNLSISFGYFSNWRFPATKEQCEKLSLPRLMKYEEKDQGSERSFMLFLHRKDLLKPFINALRVARDDPTGAVTLEMIYKKSIPEIEKEWKDWIRAQPMDEEVNLVPRSFVFSQDEWENWLRNDGRKLIWLEKEQRFTVP